MESLQDRLNEYKKGFLQRASSEKISDFDRGVADIRESGITDTALGVGAAAPDFALNNATGEQRSLYSLLQQGPVVLVWYRGGWCPYCNIALRAYQEALPGFRATGAQLVAISPETPDNSLSTKQKGELEFEVLSDPGNGVARTYGLVYRVQDYVLKHFAGSIDLATSQGNDDYELPLAATYLIDRDGTVAWRFVHPDYRMRAEPADLLSALEQLAG